MREYDVIFIVNPTFNDSKVEDAREFVRRTVTNLGGQVSEENNWGLRPFPYLVKKFRQGQWQYWKVILPPEAPNQLSFELRIRDGIIRQMVSSAVTPSKMFRRRAQKLAASGATASS
ncbi:MAG: 30S ribosomal protein S6 [bacterium]|nr:30S ribosomal protein S6 [bacterium]